MELPAGKWESETGAGRQPMNGALSRLLSLWTTELNSIGELSEPVIENVLLDFFIQG